jgi:hypothetical protein
MADQLGRWMPQAVVRATRRGSNSLGWDSLVLPLHGSEVRVT